MHLSRWASGCTLMDVESCRPTTAGRGTNLASDQLCDAATSNICTATRAGADHIYLKLNLQQAPVATATLQNSPSQQMRHPPEGTWSPTLCLWPPPLTRCFSRAWGGQMTWRTSHSLIRLASCTDTKKGFWWRGQYGIPMRLATSPVLFFIHEINYLRKLPSSMG